MPLIINKLFKPFHFAWFILICSIMLRCGSPDNLYQEVEIIEEPEAGKKHATDILKDTPVEVADGLKVSLWASDSLAPDPIAMSIDDEGKVYLTRTNRQKNSEFDIRGYFDWITSSISLQSVEDRRKFLRKTFNSSQSEENSWLKDLNRDGIHDWLDLRVEKDEVWRLEDRNQDGIADVSTRILSDFNDEVTDVAGGLLVRDNELFLAIAPDLWRIQDTDGDGQLDTKESISHGYAVHIGFGGHGMSGVKQGPDGKIYWGIGDIGSNIISKDGKAFKYPNQGVLVRANPDGSDFEVFAAGLRNTHEFAFDEYGNIIGCDNDGDHPGESERLVYIVEGSDAGWRTNWQFGKYTDPKNNKYKVWMDEKLFVPRWKGQAAYIIPPIQNFHNGPTGMVYNPGTALGSQWRNKFFVVEFVGTPSRSPLWAFDLKTSGASFELNKEEKVFSGILPTGIHFGPDGALYVADWINGWGTKNYGRVWRLDVTNDKDDLADLRDQTKALMVLDYKQESIERLYELLFFEDLRIRQKAQFELVERGTGGKDAFVKAINQKENQLARIHGIWGIGQMTRTKGENSEELLTLLDDSDPEIIAQTSKIIGEVKLNTANEKLLTLLEHDNDRVKFFAAQALGNNEFSAANQSLVNMILANDDKDVYLRHAGVLALSKIGDVDFISGLSTHESTAARMAGVLALRRLRHENVVKFLNDQNEYIMAEAARAIHDDWSIDKVMPQLAALLANDEIKAETIIRRAISAASRVGTNKEIDLLIGYVQKDNIDPALRNEALSVLGNWSDPSVFDRVDGRYRGPVTRDDAYVISSITPLIAQNLQSKNDEKVIGITEAITRLDITDYTDQQVELAKSHSSPDVRSKMAKSLFALGYVDIASIVDNALNDNDEKVRITALGLVKNLELSQEQFTAMIKPVFEKGTVGEQQQLLENMGSMPLSITESAFNKLIGQWIAKKLDADITLDLIEAVESSESVSLISKIEPFKPKGETTEDYLDVLYGGDANKGRSIFMWYSNAQCVRCHAVEDRPGTVGPSLYGISNRLSRKQLLEAMIEPSARLAPGYGSVVLNLTDGSRVSGILMAEHKEELIIKTSEAEPLEIPTKRISKRTNVPSGMPPMGSVLSRREIRDLVAYLSTLK